MANNNQKSYYEYFNGKAKWVRAKTPDPKFGKWNMTLYPYDEDLKKFQELQAEGVLTRLKKDDDGYYFQVSRPVNKMMKGTLVQFPSPKVIDKDGVVLEDNVGNGSDVTVKVQVYSYPKPTGGWGKAIRWEALKVNNLVPFKSDSFKDQMSKDQVAGLQEQPEPVW